MIRGSATRLPFAADAFRACVTSPPYFGKVAYGDNLVEEHGRHGLNDYVTDLLQMAREVRRVLTDDGVFWLNLGDTMAGSGGAGGDYNAGGRKDWKPKVKQGYTGIVGNQHCLVPQRVALALQEQGWWVKRWIVWDKSPQVRPEAIAHVRRPLDAHEVVLMLVKDRRYHYEHLAHKFHGIELGDVWHFAPERKKTGHQAPFPEELPKRAILLSTQRGDRVLDPYAGSGTTVRVANCLGRIGVGVDLYARKDS